MKVINAIQTTQNSLLSQYKNDLILQKQIQTLIMHMISKF